MKYYQEITLIDGDRRLYEVWSNVYTQIHIALADLYNNHGINSVGVSFPDYRYEEKNDKAFAILGNKLRVFAPNQKDLETLNLNDWLSRLTDYVHIKSISEVGDKVKGHLVVSRYRPKNPLKQAEEFAKYKDMSLEAALVHCAAHKQDNKPYPHINLKSETNQQPYKLAIIQEVTDSACKGSFNSYGMNNKVDSVTVPHW